jgi:hypothetical protein
MDDRNRQRFGEDGQLLGSVDECEHCAGNAAAGRGAGGRYVGRRGGGAPSVRRASLGRCVQA